MPMSMSPSRGWKLWWFLLALTPAVCLAEPPPSGQPKDQPDKPAGAEKPAEEEAPPLRLQIQPHSLTTAMLAVTVDAGLPVAVPWGGLALQGVPWEMVLTYEKKE